MPDRDLVRKTKIEIFKAVLALDPKAPVVGELAESLLEDRQYEEALRVAREGITFHPDLLSCRVVLAESLEALGRTDEAREALESARRKADQVHRSLDRLAGLETRMAERPERGGADSDEPPVELPSPTLAELYLRQGDQEAAIRVLRQVLAKDPENLSARQKLEALTGEAEAAPEDDAGRIRFLAALERWLAASRARAADSTI